MSTPYPTYRDEQAAEYRESPEHAQYAPCTRCGYAIGEDDYADTCDEMHYECWCQQFEEDALDASVDAIASSLKEALDEYRGGRRCDRESAAARRQVEVLWDVLFALRGTLNLCGKKA